MSKHRETAADRLWKEKLDLCVSSREVVALIVIVAITAFFSFMAP